MSTPKPLSEMLPVIAWRKKRCECGTLSYNRCATRLKENDILPVCAIPNGKDVVDLKGEVWEPLADIYHVSNFGRAKTKSATGTRLLTIRKSKYGYCWVNVRIGEKTNHFLHRLVAKVFIPNPENKPEVNHIDGDKTNNCVNNLEWCTSSENKKHAVDTGLTTQGEKNAKAKLTKDEVRRIVEMYRRSEYELGVVTFSDLARKNNVTPGVIREIITRKSYKSVA